jgi:hypothetical protein
MKKLTLWISVLIFSAGTLQAQDISGDWQGILHAVEGPQRIILKISVDGKGGLGAVMYDIDHASVGVPVTSITRAGSTVKYSVERGPAHISYEGTLSADGASINGNWTAGSGPRELDLVRATKETAWEIPDYSKEHKEIPVDAKIFDMYAGRYQLAPNVVVSVVHEGDHLYAQSTGQQRFELFPEGDKEFFAKVAPIQISFHTDGQTDATEMVVHQGGKDMVAKRILEPTTR